MATPQSNEWDAVSSLAEQPDAWDSVSSLAETPESTNVLSTIADVAGAAGKGLGAGVTSLATGPFDIGTHTPTFLHNMVERGQSAVGLNDNPQIYEYPPSVTEEMWKALGGAKTTPGKYAESIASFVPAFMMAAKGQPQGLLKHPITQAIISGGGSEGAGQATEGTWMEPYARLIGSMAPTGLQNLPKYLKGLLRGDSLKDVATATSGVGAKKVNENLDAFTKTGTTPTAGQATENRALQAIEGGLSKLPGGAGVMAKRAEQQATDIGESVEDLASRLAPKSSGEQAGRAIKEGITGTFIPQARKTQKALYNKLDSYIKPESQIGASDTMDVLNRLTAPIKGAKALSETPLMSNPLLKDMKAALNKDMGATPGRVSTVLDAQGNPIPITGTPASGKMPYEAIKDFRTRIGEKLSDFELASDIPKAQLKQLYGALSKDMETAARQQGPEAYRAFQRANQYTSAMHNRIDALQHVLDRNGGPENIFNAALSGSKDGATTLRAVMRSMPDDGKKMLSSTVLRRMGRATPGQQNDLGDVFSTSTFLTNWNKMSPQAKEVLFRGYGPSFSKDMDSISKVASNLKSGSKVFQNPSGTAPSTELMRTILTFLGAGYAGATPIQTAAGIAGAYGTSKLMTSPKFVRWLASTSGKPMSYKPAAVASLLQISRESGDDNMKSFAEELE